MQDGVCAGGGRVGFIQFHVGMAGRVLGCSRDPGQGENDKSRHRLPNLLSENSPEASVLC